MDELSGFITEAGAARMVANALKVNFSAPSGVLTVDKVLGGMRSVEIVGKVKQVYEVREFSSANRSGKVGSFLLVDTTGIIRIVVWNDKADLLKEFEVGDVIKIKNGYSKNNNGRVEVHLGDQAELLRNPEGVSVDVDVTKSVSSSPSVTKKIAELTEQDQNASVIATIVQVYDPRFFESKRNPGEMNYVMNVFLDDGTDNIRCVLWSDQLESLLGMKRDEILAFNENPGTFEQQKTDLLGMIVKIRGKVSINQAYNNKEFVAYEIEKNVDLSKEGGALAGAVADSGSDVTASSAAAPSVASSPESSTSVVKEESVAASTEPSTPEVNMPEVSATDSGSNNAAEDVKKPEESAAANDDDLFTLDDIEDLDSLDD